MTDRNRETLAAALSEAIKGSIEVTRWKFVWGRIRRGQWVGRSDVECLWTRPSSARAILAKERKFNLKVETADDNGSTVWGCKYKTDRHGF